jgi:hypothetical protein
LLLVQSYAPDKASYINCLELSPSHLASTFESWFFLLLVRETSVSYWGKTWCYAHHTFLSEFPTGCLTRTTRGPLSPSATCLCHQVPKVSMDSGFSNLQIYLVNSVHFRTPYNDILKDTNKYKHTIVRLK